MSRIIEFSSEGPRVCGRLISHVCCRLACLPTSLR